MSPKSQNASGAPEGNSDTSTPSAPKDTPGMALSRRQSTASATNEIVSTTVLLKMSDPPPNVGNDSASQESQTREKSVLNGTKPAAAKDSGSGTASPYGTRSRNRTGASRPNYAEDKDLDVEMFEPDRREDESKKATRQAGSANASQGGAAAPRPSNGSSSRKPLPTESTHHAAQKEQTSTTTSNSTPSAVTTPAPSTQPSRKRKAATSQASTPASGHVQQSLSNGATTTVQRRPAVVSHSGIGYSETNMLTFENCAGKPKDGKIIADDGTVLEVNGECIWLMIFISPWFCPVCSFSEVAGPPSCWVSGHFSDSRLQITSTWFVSRLASLTTLAASWSFFTRGMMSNCRLMLYVSIGTIGPRTSDERCKTRGSFSPRCTQT